MKKKLLASMLLFALMGSILQPNANSQAAESTISVEKEPIISDCEYEEGTVIVTLAAPKRTTLTRKGTTSFDSDIKVEQTIHIGDASPLAHTKEQKEFLDEKEFYISEVSSDEYSTKDLIKKLENKAYVVRVEPNYKQYLNSTNIDPMSDKQWYLNGASETGTSPGIAHAAAKGKPRTGSPVIAIMDTGINYTHEDLADRMWTNTYSELDGVHGYDFMDLDTDPMDVDGHGTHCAGIAAAASDNGKGIAGISNAELMALKIFSNGDTDDITILLAMHYLLRAKRLGVNIVAVNCSWGGGTSSKTLPSLIEELGDMGVTFVFGSGNESLNHDMNSPTSCPYDLYQANPNLRKYMIIVGATDRNDNVASFSDYGTHDVDLFAPGHQILSTYIETAYFPSYYADDVEEEITFRYLPLDDGSDLQNIYHDEQIGVSSDINTDISFSPEANFPSRGNSGSIEWTMDLGAPSSFVKSSYLYLDVTDAGLDPEATYYVSSFLGMSNAKGEINWEHMVQISSGPEGSEGNRFYIAPDGRMYIKIIGFEIPGVAEGRFSYYVDDIGISTANPNVEKLGQYKICSGTSMAAPMVTGAIGLLHELYPSDNTYNRKRRLLSCVRKTASTENKCSSGGILDLTSLDSYIPEESPVISPDATPDSAISNPDSTMSQTPSTSTSPQKILVKKLKINAQKKTLRAKKTLRLKAVVTPSNASNKKVRWSSSKKKWATVTQKGVVKAKKAGIGHVVKITAKAKDGSRKTASIKIKIKK